MTGRSTSFLSKIQFLSFSKKNISHAQLTLRKSWILLMLEKLTKHQEFCKNKLNQLTEWWFDDKSFISNSLPINKYLWRKEHRALQAFWVECGPVLISLVKIFKSTTSGYGRYFMITHHVLTIIIIFSKFTFGLDIIFVEQKLYFSCEIKHYWWKFSGLRCLREGLCSNMQQPPS